MKIGIPKALYYHKYGYLWKKFFEYLEIPYIVSENTNKNILEQGKKHATDETCIPCKIYLGHIENLKNKLERMQEMEDGFKDFDESEAPLSLDDIELAEANLQEQLKALGFSFDWSRKIDTTDPEYYKWTQWIFIQLYKKGLAYKATMPINFC